MSRWPVRSEDLARIESLYAEMTNDRGRVLIVSGGPGSGRTALIRAATEALRTTSPSVYPPPLVRSGRISTREDERGRFVPWEDEQNGPPVQEAAALIESVLGAGAKALPVLWLVAAPLSVSRAARNLVHRLRERGELGQSFQFETAVLREAALDRPLVCLIDDADNGAGSFWRDLEFSLAADIATNVPLFLVLTIKDVAEPGAQADAEQMSRQLESRGLAERLRLQPFTCDDIHQWIGRADADVVDQLLHVTWGRPGLLQSVWGNWTRCGSVAPAPGDGRWIFTPAADEAGLGSVNNALRDQLEHLVSDFNSDVALLRCAAIEGRQFTAEVVASALRRPNDDVTEALDRMVQRQSLAGTTVIEHRRTVVIPSRPGSQRQLAVYGFVSPWHWLALRAGLSPDEHKQLAMRIADALVRLYEPDLWRVAAALADLSIVVGDVDAAARYQRRADFAGPDDALRSQVERIVTADVSEWDAWQCARAGYVLLEAIGQLRRSTPIATRRVYATQARELGERARNGPLQVDAHLWEGRLAVDSDDYRTAREHLDTARRIAAEISYHVGEAHAWNDLGVLEQSSWSTGTLFEMASDLDRPGVWEAREAIETAYQAALAKWETLGNVAGQAAAHIALAKAASLTRDHETELVEYQTAVKLLRRAGGRRRGEGDADDTSTDVCIGTDDVVIAHALLCLAVGYLHSGMPEEADTTYQEVVSLGEQITARLAEEDDYFALPLVAWKLGYLDAMRRALGEILRFAVEVQDRVREDLARRAIEAFDNLRRDALPRSTATSPLPSHFRHAW